MGQGLSGNEEILAAKSQLIIDLQKAAVGHGKTERIPGLIDKELCIGLLLSPILGSFSHVPQMWIASANDHALWRCSTNTEVGWIHCFESRKAPRQTPIP